MANSFEFVSDWLAMSGLDLLETKRGLSQYMNTDYNAEFNKNFPVGDAIRVPYPAQFTIRQGLNYIPQDIVRRHAHIEFQEPFGVDFEWDSAEEALRTPRGRAKVEKEIFAPAMAQLSQEIDSRAALYMYQNAANVVGSLGVNPTTYDGTSAACKQLMEEYGCPPDGERALVVPPAVMRAVKGANLALFNPVADISKQFRNGIIGHSDGFDWFSSMSLFRHIAGTQAAPHTVSVAPTNGATSMTVAGVAGETWRAGDKFNMALVRPVHPLTKRVYGPATTLKTFTVTADATVPAAGTVTLNFSPAIYATGPYQNVSALPAVGAALTLWPGTAVPSAATGVVGFAVHRNAFALVSKPLEEPKGSSVEIVSQKRDPDSGISVRFIRSWDNRASKFINRFDVMIGFGTFYNDACAVALACA